MSELNLRGLNLQKSTSIFNLSRYNLVFVFFTQLENLFCFVSYLLVFGGGVGVSFGFFVLVLVFFFLAPGIILFSKNRFSLKVASLTINEESLQISIRFSLWFRKFKRKWDELEK